MLRFTIKFDPKESQQASFFIDGKMRELETRVVDFGYRTRDFMRANISSNSKRKQSGTLNRAIDVEIKKIPNVLSVGIGNIETLSRDAPYWYVVNYGKYYDSGKPFIPGGVSSYNRNLPVHKREGGISFPISVANVGFKPIQPMNFIESTLNWVSGQLSAL